MNIERDTVGLHTFMQDRKTVFCYSGPMTEDLLTTIANPVRHQLSDKETEEVVANRVFGVFIEQAQNIIRYSHQKTKSTGDSVGTIAISIADDGFLIEAVNVVSEEKPIIGADLIIESQSEEPVSLIACRWVFNAFLMPNPIKKEICGTGGFGIAQIRLIVANDAFDAVTRHSDHVFAQLEAKINFLAHLRQ